MFYLYRFHVPSLPPRSSMRCCDVLQTHVALEDSLCHVKFTQYRNGIDRPCNLFPIVDPAWYGYTSPCERETWVWRTHWRVG